MENKTEQINVRVTKKEKQRIEYLSEKLGYKHLGEYIRSSLLNIENKRKGIKEIYTLTLNPALDLVLNIDKLDSITKYENNDIEYFSGGKGINVSKVINQFNIPTTVMHYSGGFTGEFIKNELDLEKMNQIIFKSKNATRINIKLNISNDETKEINGQAEKIQESRENEILKTIGKIQKGEIIVLTGSFHKDNQDLLVKISEICFKNGVEIVYDLSEEILVKLLEFKPLLIKPNIDELSHIFGREIKTEKEIIESLVSLKKKGAKNVAITLGKEGSYFIDEQFNIYKSNVINEIKKVSSQGSGDSFVGAYLSNQNLEIIERLKISNAAGAATAAKKGIASLEEIMEMINNVHVEKIGEENDY